MKYYFCIRDVKSFEHCKPLQTEFYLESTLVNAKIVYNTILLKFPKPQYKIEVTAFKEHWGEIDLEK